ncbi:MAG: hypothetical protein RBJ76_21430 [Stenomitos frigidus ULC029]
MVLIVPVIAGALPLDSTDSPLDLNRTTIAAERLSGRCCIALYKFNKGVLIME